MSSLIKKYSNNYNVRYIVPNILQDKKNSCWWAATQMLLGTRSIPLMTDLDTQVRYHQNNGLPLDHTIFTEYLKKAGLNYVVAYAELPSPNVVGWYNVLKKRGPVMVTIKLRNQAGGIVGFHSVVVVGISESGYLEVNDPNPSNPNYVVDLVKFSNDVIWTHAMVFK